MSNIDYDAVKAAILASSAETADDLPEELKPPLSDYTEQDHFIFISYSHKDYKSVYGDLLELHRAGVHYFYDGALVPGYDWDENVKTELCKSTCSGVVFYLSTNLVRSGSAAKEIALTLGKDSLHSEKDYFAVSLSSKMPHDLIDASLKSMTLADAERSGIENIYTHESLMKSAFPNKRTNVVKTKPEGASHLKKLFAALKRFNVLPAEPMQDAPSGNFTIDKDRLVYYMGEDSELTLPNRITIINRDAFRARPGLVRVTLPPTLAVIGDNAFFGCSRLSELTIPSSVYAIGKDAFLGCDALIREELCVRYVDKWAIGGEGIGAGHIVLKADTVGISDDAFAFSGIYTVALPNGLRYIGRRAFADSPFLETVTIPSSVTHIDTGVFQSCSSLKSVKLPAGIREIGNGLFNNCPALTSFEIPKGVTSIGLSAFLACESLTSVTIPQSVKRIAPFAFGGCPKLTSITFEGSMEEWCAIEKIDSTVFANCYTVVCRDGSLTGTDARSLAYEKQELLKNIFPHGDGEGEK